MNQSSASQQRSAMLGTIRNRTDQFLKLREKGRQLMSTTTPTTSIGDETSKLLATAMGMSDVELGEETGHAPWYVEMRNEIRQDMASIRELMEEIRILHGKASLNTFDDARDDEVAVEVTTQQITKLFRKCEKSLQDFSRRFDGVSRDSLDATVQSNMQKTLALELQKLSLDFRKQQKTYLVRLRERDGGDSVAASALDLFESGNENDATYDPGLSELQSMAVASSSALAQERDKEVMKIMTSIHDLAQIMKDLSTLVIEQGTVLDRIDYNLEQTSSMVDQGVSQLKRAEKAQRRGILASCVLVLLVMIILMFVVLVVKSLLE